MHEDVCKLGIEYAWGCMQARNFQCSIYIIWSWIWYQDAYVTQWVGLPNRDHEVLGSIPTFLRGICLWQVGGCTQIWSCRVEHELSRPICESAKCFSHRVKSWELLIRIFKSDWNLGKDLFQECDCFEVFNECNKKCCWIQMTTDNWLGTSTLVPDVVYGCQLWKLKQHYMMKIIKLSTAKTGLRE